MIIPEYMNSFKRFNEEKLPARKYFLVQQKKEKFLMMVKYQTVTLSVKDYLTCEKIWDKFEMKNMGDYHDHYLKRLIRCFWKNYCYVFKILRTWFMSLFQFSWIKLGCYVKNHWCKIRKYLILTSTYLLKKD